MDELFNGFLNQRSVALANFTGEAVEEERWRMEMQYHTMGTVEQNGSMQSPWTLPMVAMHNRDMVGTNQVRTSTTPVFVASRYFPIRKP